MTYAIKYTRANERETIDINKYIKVSNRPLIPVATRVTYTADLGDGNRYYEQQDAYYDRTITISCGFCANEKDEWQRVAAIVQTYFNKDNGRLYLPDDDPETFWKVKHIAVEIPNRVLGQMSNFNIQAVVHPFQYVTRFYDDSQDFTLNGTTEVNIHNPYDGASPLYKIYRKAYNGDITFTNEQNSSVSTVKSIFTPVTSGKTVDYVEINPEEYTLKQVYTDGSYSYCNKLLRGTFDAFKLYSGHNKLEVSAVGNVGIQMGVLRRFSKL